MNKKKLLWIGVLIIAIIGIVVAIVVMNNASQSQKEAGNNDTKNLIDAQRTAPEQLRVDGEYMKDELADGTLYTLNGKKETADVVIGTNYFDTTITDMYYNPANYQDKKIEIVIREIGPSYRKSYLFVFGILYLIAKVYNKKVKTCINVY
jgi:uncharacterized membrane protein YcgQ (UPF0703/DUF1980 family)